MQTAGDCRVRRCDGLGALVVINDNGDLPADDGNACTQQACSNGMPSFPPEPVDTLCAQNGGAVCNSAGQCVGCNVAAQCPGSDTFCGTRTCNAGVCGNSFTASGTPLPTQTPGDCQAAQCNGSGSITVVALNSDVPVDGNQCTSDLCTNGVPSNPPAPINLACTQNGGAFCNATGACVACNVATQCAGSDTECRTRTCTAGVCGVTNTPALTPVATQAAGDCKTNECDGFGSPIVVNTSSDVPVDGNQCTNDVCTNGVPSNPPRPVDTACNQNGGAFCNASGACVACNVATQCSGSDTECRTRTCSTAGVCGVSFTPSGTAVAAQTPGDCQQAQCNGAGVIVSAALNSDVPVDGSQCTNDVCTNGVPSNPPLPVNSACTQNGGAFCNTTGACVACNVATQCAGSDTECRTRTCNGGVCGVNNTPALTPVPTQIAGDCKTNECDGFGALIAINTAGDVPVDGNQCTLDQCSNGTPSNLPAPIDTTCSQNGGAFCNGASACVACNVGTQCPGSDTECRTRTCSSGTCGVSFTQGGTAVSSQVAGDCQVAQCNGTGSIVSVALNSDVPVDGSQCTSDLCTDGAPSNPPLPLNAACTQNGGSFCNAFGTCVACNVGTQCPGSDTECQTRTCTSGACGVNNTPALTPVATQIAGDCKTNECDGFGALIVVNTSGDVPVDGNQCTLDQCSNGTPSNPPAPIDTTCTQSGGSFCDGSSACVACNVAAQCSGSDTECRTRTCTGGSCGVSYTPGGTAVTSQTAGDCHVNQCDGAGAITNAVNDADVPVDGNQCTSDLCNSGAPSNPPAPVNTSCSQNGGAFCNGATACVACNTASQCPGSDTDCQTRTCVSNACGLSNTPSGTAVPTQTAGDCREVQCDGSGGTTNATKDSDVPVDGNQCTDDVCTTGTPSNPPLGAGTSCTQSGGTTCDGAGVCVSAPAVASVSPADGASAAASTPIAVTFSVAMNPTTLTAQTTAGVCSGSIQVSLDGFTTCIALASASAVMSGGNTIATVTPAPGLQVNTTYRVRVTTAAVGSSGTALASAFTQATGFTTTSPNLCEGSVVISQLFGGGAGTGAPYNSDFVELHNRGSTPVSLAGWSLQYASATGTSWSVISLSGTIVPSGYYLVQVGPIGGVGAPLPTADASSTTPNMAQAAGKLALLNTTTNIGAVSCPTGATLIDFVGYGTTANCREGTATAPAPSATTSIQRVGQTCADVNANSVDFVAGAPAPRNSSSAAQACACVALNETTTPLVEADYCVVQFPTSLSATTGTTTSTVFGQLFETGVTEGPGAPTAVRAQLGYGPVGANPQHQAWTWVNATYNVQVGNNDEYQASFTAPAVGTWRYAYRFSLDQGVSWTVCDTDGTGGNAGLSFDLQSLAPLTVTP